MLYIVRSKVLIQNARVMSTATMHYIYAGRYFYERYPQEVSIAVLHRPVIGGDFFFFYENIDRYRYFGGAPSRRQTRSYKNIPYE